MNKVLRQGDKLVWSPMEDINHHEWNCTVTTVEDDYAIAKTEDGVTLWVDKDTIGDFILNGFRMIYLED